jgi:hypothetical protein
VRPFFAARECDGKLGKYKRQFKALYRLFFPGFSFFATRTMLFMQLFINAYSFDELPTVQEIRLL